MLTIRERALTVFAGGRERQGEASPQLYFIALSANALSSSMLGCRTQSQTPEKRTGPVIPFPRLNISLPVMLDLQVLLQRPSGRVWSRLAPDPGQIGNPKAYLMHGREMPTEAGERHDLETSKAEQGGVTWGELGSRLLLVWAGLWPLWLNISGAFVRVTSFAQTFCTIWGAQEAYRFLGTTVEGLNTERGHYPVRCGSISSLDNSETA